MAEKEAIFNLKVNTGNSVNDVKKFDKAVDGLDKSLKDTQKTAQNTKGTDHLEQKLKEMNKLLESGTLTFQQQTKMIKDYQGLALQAGATSPVGKQAIQQASQLRDTLTDLDNRVKLLSSDYVHLETSMQAISVGASVFQGLSSVTALVGSENEDLMKTMVKLQAVMGVTNSIHAVANALNKDSLLGIRLRIVATKLMNFVKGQETTATAQGVAVQQADVVGTGILAGAKRVLASATLSSATAMKVLRGAIVSTGIGALVLLLMEGVSALLSFGDASEEAEEQQERFNQSVERSNERISDFEQSTDRQLKKQLLQLKLRGVSEERYNEGVRKGAIQNLEKKREMIEIELQKEREKFAQLKRMRKTDLKDVVRNLNREIELKNRIKEKDDQIEIQELENKLAEKEEAEKKSGKTSTKNLKQQAEKRRGEELKLLKERLQREQQANEKIEDLRLKMMETTFLEEDGLMKLDAERQKAELILREKFEDDKNAMIEKGIKNEITALDEKFKKGKIKEDEYIKELAKLREDGLNSLTEEEKNLLNLKQNELNQSLLKIEVKHSDDVIKIKKQTEKEREDLRLKAIVLTQDQFQNDLDAFKTKQDDELKILDKALKDNLILESEYNKTKEKMAKDLADKEKQLTKDKNEFIKQQNGKAFEESVEQLTSILGHVQSGLDQLNAFNELANVLGENRIMKIEEQANQELSIIDAKQQQELSNQSLTDEEKTKLEEKFAQQRFQVELKQFNQTEKIKKAQFQREKALKVSQIGIETALAVMKSIASNGGLPIGLPFGIATGLLGATQIASVLAQKYQGGTAPTPPSMSSVGGGTAGAGGSSFVANTNTEQTNLADIIGGQNQGSGMVSQVVVLESDITSTQNKVQAQEVKTSF
jgi:hypothetical protein